MEIWAIDNIIFATTTNCTLTFCPTKGKSSPEKLALKGQNSAKLTSTAQEVKNLLKSLVVLRETCKIAILKQDKYSSKC